MHCLPVLKSEHFETARCGDDDAAKSRQGGAFDAMSGAFDALSMPIPSVELPKDKDLHPKDKEKEREKEKDGNGAAILVRLAFRPSLPPAPPPTLPLDPSIEEGGGGGSRTPSVTSTDGGARLEFSKVSSIVSLCSP